MLQRGGRRGALNDAEVRTISDRIEDIAGMWMGCDGALVGDGTGVMLNFSFWILDFG